MQIDKNVPIPRRVSPVRPIWIETAEGMEPTDSILCENRSKAQSLANALRRVGKGATTRAEGDKVRVWAL